MTRAKAKAKTGFTLVELLVVIGIIALLISILLPALGKARLQARRTQDLSNIRQVAVACVAYATENRGMYPLGSRQGPNLNVSGTNDDMAWINSYTFAWFLQFMCNRTVSQNWMSTTAPYPNGLMIDQTTQSRLCCTSMYDTPDSGATLARNVGLLTYRYYSVQTDPAGLCYCETFMGFFYWGNRAQEIQGAIYDQTGTAVSPAQTYSFPHKQGDRPSSQVLLSCPSYSSNSYGFYLPHSGNNDAFINQPTTVSTPGDGLTGPTAQMRGLCFAYIDGSAKWVPRKQLWSMYEGGYDWIYFDKTRP